MYPSSLITIPEPSASAVPCLFINIEFTVYSTFIPTIDGCTFAATAIPVSEYFSNDICVVLICELVLVEFVVTVVALLLPIIFSFISGIPKQVPKTIPAPKTPLRNGTATVFANPLDFVFLFFEFVFWFGFTALNSFPDLSITASGVFVVLFTFCAFPCIFDCTLACVFAYEFDCAFICVFSCMFCTFAWLSAMLLLTSFSWLFWMLLLSSIFILPFSIILHHYIFILQ